MRVLVTVLEATASRLEPLAPAMALPAPTLLDRMDPAPAMLLTLVSIQTELVATATRLRLEDFSPVPA